MAKDSLGLVFSRLLIGCLARGHPERQERLLYTRDQLEEEGFLIARRLRSIVLA